jgi:hypothetical protein
MATATKLTKTYKYHYVYKITNLFPETEKKFYIGTHSCNVLPEKDNYWGSSVYLDEAIAGQGVTDFAKEILSTWKTREEANAEEERIHWELDVRNHPEFYNRCNASAEFHNGGWSDATKQKVSEMNKIRCARPEVKQQKSESSKKMWQDEEYRNKVTLKIKEKYVDPEFRAKMLEMIYAHAADPEIRKKVSEGVKKSWADPKAKEERSVINKVSANTPKEKQRRAESARRQWQDPEFRALMKVKAEGRKRKKMELQES